jgi:hypothetical protein
MEGLLADRLLYLGIVERIQRRSDNHQTKQRSGYALLRPLYKASADFSEWLPIDDPKEGFPNRGFVTWYAAPEEATEGSVWQFRIEESFTYEKDNPERDQFFTAKSFTPAPALEVIDWRREDQPYDAEIVRRDVVYEGIWLPHPPSPLTYLWVDDQRFIGPIHLEQRGSKWGVSPEQTQQRYVAEFSLSEDKVSELRIAGLRRLFLAPNSNTGAPLRSLDWSPDDVVLKRILQWLRKADAEYAATAQLTKEALNRASSLVRNEALTDAESTVRRHQLQRALALVSTLDENSGLAQTILEDVLRMPSVVAIVNEAAAAERQRAHDQIKAELASETSQVNTLKAVKASLEEEIQQLEKTHAEKAAEAAQQIEESKAALESAMAEQLSDIMSQPAKVLANIAILRTALGFNESNNPYARPPEYRTEDLNAADSASLACTWLKSSKTHVKILNRQEELRQSLREMFELQQFEPAVVRTLHAGFISGAMPVLVGGGAYEAIASYASCVAGGRLLWIPVPPTVLEPGDLLGRLNTQNMHFIPHPGGLLDLLLHARDSDELYVVALDGINRAPIDAYLSPILSLYSEIGLEEQQRRILPLLPVEALNKQNPYSAATRLTWPPNVLLSSIWSEGAVGVPPPSAFWDGAALIQIGQLLTIDKTSSHRKLSDSTPSAVSPTHWLEWQDVNQEREASPTQMLQKLIVEMVNDGFSLSKKRASMCAEFYEEVKKWGQSDAEALQDTALCCLAPRLIASGSNHHLLLEAIEQASGTSGDIEVRFRKMQMLIS